MKKQLKGIRLPVELIKKIEETERVGKYLDFSTKVILLLERALEEKDGPTNRPKSRKTKPSKE